MNSSEILVNMAEAAAKAIIAKMEQSGMTTAQAEAYVKAHESEVIDFALRLIARHHLGR